MGVIWILVGVIFGLLIVFGGSALAIWAVKELKIEHRRGTLTFSDAAWGVVTATLGLLLALVGLGLALEIIGL